MIRILPRWKLWPRWKKVTFGIYVVGVVAFGLLTLWSTYQSGGFSRSHTIAAFLIIGGLDLLVVLLWPLYLILIATLLLLVWLGVIPR